MPRMHKPCRCRAAHPFRLLGFLPPADQPRDPVNRALGGVGCAIAEGAKRGDAFRCRRTGMSLGRIGEPLEGFPRYAERLAECTSEMRGHRRATRASQHEYAG